MRPPRRAPLRPRRHRDHVVFGDCHCQRYAVRHSYCDAAPCGKMKLSARRLIRQGRGRQPFGRAHVANRKRGTTTLAVTVPMTSAPVPVSGGEFTVDRHGSMAAMITFAPTKKGSAHAVPENHEQRPEASRGQGQGQRHGEVTSLIEFETTVVLSFLGRGDPHPAIRDYRSVDPQYVTMLR